MVHPNNFITDAFSWSITKEGFNFWLDMSTRWQKIIYRQKNANHNPKNITHAISKTNSASISPNSRQHKTA